MKRLLREPLLHFLLLGAGLFVVYSLMTGPARDRAPETIVVTAGRIDSLKAGFEATESRPPSDAELAALIEDWVHEEVATREAMALGLDKDDAVIRARLRQKLEFVATDNAAPSEPTDAELSAYLEANPELFRIEPEFTFRQVALDPARHGDHLAGDAARLLARLNRAGPPLDPSTVGDPSKLEPGVQLATKGEIATQFGEEFAAKVGELPIGRWEGPLASRHGAHLVLLTERTEARLPALAEVREWVRREWEKARRQEGSKRLYRELLKRATVIVEGRDTK